MTRETNCRHTTTSASAWLLRIEILLIITLALLLFITTRVASAQTTPAADPAQDPVTSTVTSDDPAAREEARGPRVADKKFWLVAGSLHGAMSLDTKSTFDALARCPRCEESNPYAAPFIERGPIAAFTAGHAFDAGVMLVAYGMKSSSKPQLRKTWWLVPVALTTGHLIAYDRNRRMGQ